MWNGKCEKLDWRKVNRKKLGEVMNNMNKIKKVNRKKSRSAFYDHVTESETPSYEKDFSFLSPSNKSISRPFKPIIENHELDFQRELNEIIRELEGE